MITAGFVEYACCGLLGSGLLNMLLFYLSLCIHPGSGNNLKDCLSANLTQDCLK